MKKYTLEVHYVQKHCTPRGMCVANLPTFSNRTYVLRLVMRAFRLEIVATSRLESSDIIINTRCVECFHAIFRDQRIDPETGASACVCVCVRKKVIFSCDGSRVTYESTYPDSLSRDRRTDCLTTLSPHPHHQRLCRLSF